MSKKKEKYQHNYHKADKTINRLNNEKLQMTKRQEELVQEIQRLEMMAQTQEMNMDFPGDYGDNDLDELDEMREESYDGESGEGEGEGDRQEQDGEGGDGGDVGDDDFGDL